MALVYKKFILGGGINLQTSSFNLLLKVLY